MARVLLFLQIIVALVVLPFWPGLSPVFSLWGGVYLAVILAVPLAAATAVYGSRDTVRALADAWSPVSRDPGSRDPVRVWALIARTFPAGGVLGGLTAAAGALSSFDPGRALGVQVGIMLLFCLVWGFVGLLVSRILGQVVARLEARPRSSLAVLTAELGARAGLTPRETEAAQAVLDGLTYPGAAEKLGIAPATVKSHVLSVYQKTGAGNKIELLRWVEAETGRLHRKADGPADRPGRR